MVIATKTTPAAVGCSMEADARNKLPTRKYRWIVLVAVWMAFLLTYIDRIAWSSIAATVGSSIGISVGLLGAFVTAFYVGYVLANVVGGFITDVIGSRATLVIALVPLGIATFAFGNAHSLSEGVWIQLIMGVAAGADYAASIKILTIWFEKDRGLAMGIFATATSVAVVVANSVVPYIASIYQWSVAFRIFGSVTVAWAIVCLITLRNSPLPRLPRSLSHTGLRELLLNRNLIILSIAGFGGFWATVGFGAWGNTLMIKQYGISPITAGEIMSTFGIGAIIGKPALGWIRDHSRPLIRRLLPVGCLIIFSALLIVWSQCSTTSEFFIVAPLLGIAAYGYTPLLYLLIADFSNKSAVGAAAGFANAVFQMGAVASPLIVGASYSQTHSFAIVLAILAVGPCFGALLLLLLPRLGE